MSEPVVGAIIDGRYQLEELIGKGGMGLVFRARHVFTHQQVALKLITTDGLDPDTMSRFLDEARVAATIGHPAIVETSDANRTAEGQLYIVMELLVGQPLRSAMVKGLTAADIKRIALELLDAIDAAHARGVVHRDLKPAIRSRSSHATCVRQVWPSTSLATTGAGMEWRSEATTGRSTRPRRSRTTACRC